MRSHEGVGREVVGTGRVVSVEYFEEAPEIDPEHGPTRDKASWRMSRRLCPLWGTLPKGTLPKGNCCPESPE
jgi:hypothetical protein